MLRIKYLVVCLLVISVYAEPECVVKGGGILDDIVLQFGRAATGWQTTIEPLAKKFFFILFGMEFMWQLTVKKVFAGDIEKLWVFFFTRTVLCFFFAKYLVNVEMYKGIIEFLSGLGSSIGGFTLNLSPGSGANTLGPSAVVSSFSCMADMIHKVTDQTGTFEYITVKITLAIIQVLLFIVLVCIAYYLMQIILQAYLLIYAGFLFAGFAGSSWTMNYWQRYMSAVIAVGSKFLVVCLIMGVLNTQMKSWAHDINQATGVVMLVAVILRVFATALIIAMALRQLPGWFASVLSSGISQGDQIANPLNGMANMGHAVGSLVQAAVSGKSGSPAKPRNGQELVKPIDLLTGQKRGNSGTESSKPNPFGNK